jgi:4-hydroxy-2-oxoheptanedioate aldolase
MRKNAIREKIAAGKAIVNGWLGIPSAYSAEVMAHQGFDSVTVDLQHGAIDYQAAFGMLQAISTTAAVPLVRVPWNEPGIMMKLLDAGTYGIICPMINSKAEAEAFVAACRYPPRGFRSNGPNRALLYGGADYLANANAEIVLLAMIETKAGLENLDAILSVPGLDGTYIGPTDLALSFGKPISFDPTDPDVVGAMTTIRAKTRAKGLIAGTHTDGGATCAKRFAEGFTFATVLNDARLLANTAAAGEAG